mmetsp:Transcript_45996/g.133281  ORF Transcript_45996/g.133281 Transcript_45996/m.133281 type:complete len:361 (-) Transcript_45996:9-1091(-)
MSGLPLQLLEHLGDRLRGVGLVLEAELHDLPDVHGVRQLLRHGRQSDLRPVCSNPLQLSLLGEPLVLSLSLDRLLDEVLVQALGHRHGLPVDGKRAVSRAIHWNLLKLLAVRQRGGFQELLRKLILDVDPIVRALDLRNLHAVPAGCGLQYHQPAVAPGPHGQQVQHLALAHAWPPVHEEAPLPYSRHAPRVHCIAEQRELGDELDRELPQHEPHRPRVRGDEREVPGKLPARAFWQQLYELVSLQLHKSPHVPNAHSLRLRHPDVRPSHWPRHGRLRHQRGGRPDGGHLLGGHRVDADGLGRPVLLARRAGRRFRQLILGLGLLPRQVELPARPPPRRPPRRSHGRQRPPRRSDLRASS